MKKPLLFLVAGWIACASVAFAQSAQSTSLVIYRRDYKHHWEPSPLYPMIAVNGMNLVRMPDKRYFRMSIKPGKYIFDANPSKGGRYSRNHAPGQHGKLGSSVTVFIRPGTTCYLAVRQIKPPMFGTWSDHIERAASGQAEQDLPGLHRVKPKFVDPGVVYKFE